MHVKIPVTHFIFCEYSHEKTIRINEKSSILGAAWLEKYAYIFMIKMYETKHFQMNFTSKILKIIKMHEFLRL